MPAAPAPKPAPEPAVADAPPPPPADASAWLEALRLDGRISAPVALVAAHPDDETLGLGSRLASFDQLTLVQVTDGAPADPADARRAGCADRDSYRAARAAEQAAALAELGASPTVVRLGVPDQEAVRALPALIGRLVALLDGCEAVITHAYEGGHPDHDACALAVQRACDRLARAPVRLEFAGYHLAAGARVTGAFWPDAACAEARLPITPGRLGRKRAALARYRTQAQVVDWFDPAVERARAAPRYDFGRPPPPGSALYDSWGWELTSERWRELAAGALQP